MVAVNLWSDLLILKGKWEERSEWSASLGPTDDDELVLAVWKQALGELNTIIERHTRQAKASS
jgi:hypothetical protein